MKGENMVNLEVGQTIRVNIAVWDFCGEAGYNAIYISEVGINTVPALDSDVRCLDITGLAIAFRLVTAGDARCRGCDPEVVYSTWGTAYTDSRGYAYIDHKITEADLAAYQVAVSSGSGVRVLACITGAKGQQIIRHRCSDSITFTPALPPTHYISLSLGFVPPELITCFETYISAISDNLMTYLAPPPSPWVYVRTTYDRITNSFNIWLYLPETAVLSMSPGALQDIYDFIAAWAPLVIGIMLILIAAFGPFGVLADIVLLFAGLVILAWKVVDATSKQLLAETIATNLDTQISQDNKESQGKQLVEDTWEKSGKTSDDCLTRLSARQSNHNAKIKGYLDIYAKYPNFVTKLTAESTKFTTNANAIISGFKAQAYTADVCSTYAVQMDNEINSSNLRMNDLLSTFVPPDVPYSVPCKGWTN
ncbi:MAG: hypothetical protein Q8S44_06565, partial [Flavobacteriaceae bacterium]|nr:hypothetical protein [Flavobacteriaceae bacterium]